MGQAVPELASELRRFPVVGFLIFYRGASYGIEVLRVLHGARDIEAVFHDHRF
jgi:toxin ParE1/3/4